jgi:SAM-dependent methyltransferase
MNHESLIASWRQDERQPFTGWDFSYINGRILEEARPWSYPEQAMRLMQRSSSMLDMGTGGGERLLAMQDNWPSKVVVTEDYSPNVAIAREHLEPLGVVVQEVRLTEDDPMPFAEQEFDLVINRHAAFNCNEVARILTRDGTFLTQQVHGLWAQDLFDAFDTAPQWPHCTPERYVPMLEQAGLHIATAEEWRGTMAFLDVGALVYYLKANTWVVPGFSVDTHVDYLLALQRRLDREGRLTFDDRSYLIEGQKRY